MNQKPQKTVTTDTITDEGQIIQASFFTGLKSPEIAVNRHHRPGLESFRLSPEDRLTLYIYAELIEPGKGNKPAKTVVRVNKSSRQYRAGNVASYNRVFQGVLEQAVQIACNHLYQLKAEGKRFSRVFISQFEEAQKAKQDPDSFNYSFEKGI